MRALFWILLLPLLLAPLDPADAAGLGLPVGVGQDTDDDTDPEADDDQGKQEIPGPPFANLVIPDDLDADQRDALKDAKRAFKRMRASGGNESATKAAKKELKRASRKVPESGIPDYYLGRVYFDKSDFKKARKAFETVLKRNPQFYEAYTQVGWLEYYDEDYAAAIEQFERALAIYPFDRDALEGKGTTLVSLQRLDEALEAFQLAASAGSPEAADWVKQVSVASEGPDWGQTYVAETENYVVKTPVSQEFADEIADMAELIRKLYKKAFPKVKRSARKYQILVFASKGQYHQYGGSVNAAGHYISVFKILYLYKSANFEDTLMVLNHEGLHQFLDEFLESIPQWFNEGLGDYFGPSEYVEVGGKDAMRIRPNWWRLNLIKAAINRNMYTPLPELMTMSREEMYGPKASVNYAAAWSLVYFCFEGRKNNYKETLKKYFRAIKGGRSIDAAYRSTFAKLDMKAFEREWRKFTLELRQN